jgi:hypothetical protein
MTFSKTIALVLLLVAGEYASYFLFTPTRPSSDDRFERKTGVPFENVIGQNGGWQVVYGLLLVGMVYWAKTEIVYRCRNDMFSILLFGLLVVACLPFLWVFVTTDWNNEAAELAYWLTLPIGLLTIPTIGLVIDLVCRPYREAKWYVIKTCIEVLLIPVFLNLWIVIEFLLGFYWI